MYYHFKIPNNNLDYGLQALENDADVMNLVRYIDKYKLNKFYIEHEYTVLETYLKSPQKFRLKETVDVESSALVRKPFKKPGLKVNRLPQLLLEVPCLNTDVEVPSFNVEKEKQTTDYDVSESNEMAVNEDENVSKSNEEVFNEDETVSESGESDDSQDRDFIVDEDNLINEFDGIIPAIVQVFLCAEHRFYVRHVYENFKAQWKGRANYDVLLNNLCEVFNRQLIDARDVPIIICLEFVREYLMKRIVNVKKVISNNQVSLPPGATKCCEMVEQNIKKVVHMKTSVL
uniref:Uncharacterized protein n=1 Tax=Tanacetum cinerariifolium TaxID=118510 RepID=A0A6L2P9P7_TANCI|nr:hypothetical protein [Tanacetum cinerariifolium]